MLTYSEAKTKVNMKKSEPIPNREVFGFSNSAFVNEQAGANVSACLYRENHALDAWFKKAYGDKEKTCYDN